MASYNKIELAYNSASKEEIADFIAESSANSVAEGDPDRFYYTVYQIRNGKYDLNSKGYSLEDFEEFWKRKSKNIIPFSVSVYGFDEGKNYKKFIVGLSEEEEGMLEDKTARFSGSNVVGKDFDILIENNNLKNKIENLKAEILRQKEELSKKSKTIVSLRKKQEEKDKEIEELEDELDELKDSKATGLGAIGNLITPEMIQGLITMGVGMFGKNLGGMTENTQPTVEQPTFKKPKAKTTEKPQEEDDGFGVEEIPAEEVSYEDDTLL